MITQDVAPPIDSKEQLLPFERLAWENFERLNLRLARLRGEVRGGADHVPAGSPRRLMSQQQALNAGLYGTRGQNQEGIDLYVQLPVGEHSLDGRRTYLTLQSRRIVKLTATGLRAAVTDFLKGAWADITRVFVFAVSLPGVERGFDEEVRKQRDRLAAVGIAFEVWDAENLSARLKTEPLLVDDFFGRPWVERFCPEGTAARIGRRLDATQVGSLRSQLTTFYTAFFDVRDSGMAALQSAQAPRLPLNERFVVPDVLVSVSTEQGSQAARTAPPLATSLELFEQAQQSAYGTTDPKYWAYANPGHSSTRMPDTGRANAPLPAVGVGFEIRSPVDAWLASAHRHLLVGGPGSGKSTFLRFALLDLWSDEPVLKDWAARFGGRFPVWLPFHFFAQHRAKHDGAQGSVTACLQAWLERNDGADLWDLVKDALEDDRVYLLVDGLDEWEDEKAANDAAAALVSFLNQRELPALISTRPYGTARVRLAGAWDQAELAPLSGQQQQALARIWFDATLGDSNRGKDPLDPNSSPSRDEAIISRVADEFFRDIDASGELRDLAKVPLFLLLLVSLRLSGIQLPHRRFAVYERIVDLLLLDHPAARAASAAVPGERTGLPRDYVRAVLAQTAFAHQERGQFGPATQSEVRQDVISALTNPVYCAMDPASAAAASRQFIDIAEGELGVLVRQGPRELGFFHRALLEQLAAEYVVDYLEAERVPALIAEHADDPRWAEVILAIIWRIPPKDCPAAVAALEQLAVPDRPDGTVAIELLAEIVFGGFKIPPSIARTQASRILDLIDTAAHLPLRQRLLKSVVAGLGERPVAELATERITRWAVCNQRLLGELFLQLGEAIDDESLRYPMWTVLLEAFRSEDLTVVQAAANAFTKRYGHGAQRGSAMQALIAGVRSAATADHAALLLQSLAREWPEEHPVLNAIAHARCQRPKSLRLVGIGAALGVLAGAATLGREPADVSDGLPEVTAEEREWLIDQLDVDDYTQDIWRPLLVDAMLASVADDPVARDSVLAICLEILDARPKRLGGRHLAWAVVLAGFRATPRVVEFICTLVRDDGPKVMFLGDMSLGQAYAGHRQVADAVEDYLRSEGQGHMEPTLYALALIDQGPVMRQVLLQALVSGSAPQWAAAALVSHWRDDMDVQQAVREVLEGETVRASHIAVAALPILGATDALRLLLDLLASHTAENQHHVLFVTTALMNVCDALGITQGTQADQVAGACLSALSRAKPPWIEDGIDEELIAGLPGSAVVREHVNAFLDAPQPPLTTIAYGYRNDPQMIDRVVDRLCRVHPPLPVAARRTLNGLLRDHPGDSEVVREITRQWPLEDDPLSASAASAAHHTHLLRQRHDGALPDEAWHEAQDMLRRYAVAGSFRNWGPERAAWLGILITDSLHLLDGLTRANGLPVRLSLGDLARETDYLLLTEIADRWQSIRTRFGDSAINLLTSWQSSDSDAVWGYLALVADREPVLSDDLARALAQNPRLLQQDGVLAWYANAHQGQPGLLETLWKATTDDQSNVRGLGSLLLADFRTLDLDPSAVRDLLHAQLPRLPWADSDSDEYLPDLSSAVEILADAFPEDPKIHHYWSLLTKAKEDGEPIYMSQRTYFPLVYAAVPTDKLLEQIAHDITYTERHGTNAAEPQFPNALIRRLRRDANARTHVAEHVAASSTSDSEAAQMSTLLAAAGPLEDAVVANLKNRLSRQHAAPMADSVHDFVTARDLPVPMMIQSILEATLR